MKQRIVFIILHVILISSPSNGIIAYDCQGTQMNITTLNLNQIGSCKLPTDQVLITKELIQLLQIKDVELIPVFQCKIHIIRLITHCGMHSHSSSVVNGLATYIHPVSREMCIEMHKTKMVKFYGKVIDHLNGNGTTTASLLMAGRMTSENSCVGEFYEDHKGSWSNVIVQATVDITLQNKLVPVKIDQNQINLGGITCPYKERFCIDSIYGYSFWEHVNNDQCSNNKYTVLYEGTATKLVPANISIQNYDVTVYSVDMNKAVFAMPISRPTMICGQSAYETDHPKFFIIKPSENGMFYFTKKTLTLFDMDPTTYINTKVVFLEKHLRGQMNLLYKDVVNQKCTLEQQVLRNLQILAITSPTEFAYAKMQVPGYTAVNHGEIVHIIQCVPVEVSIRKTENCYNELPVSYDNKSLFMSPRNHILLKYGTEIGCNPFLFSAFEINGKWYKNSRGIHLMPPPEILNPINENNWQYKNPMNLFAGGLYSQEDMNKLYEHLILPEERRAVEGIITRGMMGITPDMQGTNFEKLIDQNSIVAWIENVWAKLFSWIMIFGNVSSALIGLYMICKGLKIIIDTIIHGFVLYDIFGWNVRLIAALFDSITMYCIYRKQKFEKTTNTNDERKNQEENEQKGHDQDRLYPAVDQVKNGNQTWLNV